MSSTQANPLLGTWKLISASAILPDGMVMTDVYGMNPTGYITYTADGHMMVMFSRSDRPSLSKPVRSPLSRDMDEIPVEELAAAFTSFNAYAGTYRLNDNTVTHQLDIASIPNRVGTTLVRTFSVEGNRLTLKTSPTLSDGVLMIFELVWERLETASCPDDQPVNQFLKSNHLESHHDSSTPSKHKYNSSDG